MLPFLSLTGRLGLLASPENVLVISYSFIHTLLYRCSLWLLNQPHNEISLHLPCTCLPVLVCLSVTVLVVFASALDIVSGRSGPLVIFSLWSVSMSQLLSTPCVYTSPSQQIFEHAVLLDSPRLCHSTSIVSSDNCESALSVFFSSNLNLSPISSSFRLHVIPVWWAYCLV